MTKVPPASQNVFVITGVRYIGVMFHTFYGNFGDRGWRTLFVIYRGLGYKQVRQIVIPSVHKLN